uniref:Uncharacterized protein n=1 Tax=Arion vulgaris TaxID=1028688 RepID=A0A0B6YJ45_9EUPU
MSLSFKFILKKAQSKRLTYKIYVMKIPRKNEMVMIPVTSKHKTRSKVSR